MQAFNVISLKSVPAARLLVAFVTGILIQWYLACTLNMVATAGFIIMSFVTTFFFFPDYQKYKWQWLQGTLILLLFIVLGALVTYTKDIRHQQEHLQKAYTKKDILIATIDEPLVTKPNSYKAIAKVTKLQNNNKAHQTKGSILIYFKKDSTIASQIGYGSQIAFSKPLQEIQNAGNAGSFDYKRYLLFQGITSQVYLQATDFIVLPQKNVAAFQILLQQIRAYVINALQTYVSGKQEQAVAEALLIGYRNDLDKQLVKSYSHTGVVHIIAISGLHLGMIYGLLLWMFSPFKNRRWYRFVMPLTTLAVLWLFTLVAGAVPSIVRSAVMFSFIVLGECLKRKGNIYNTLAVSALCLLVYNPFYLWDVGFQLSYAAVLSIIVFMKPIYNQLYFENKFINKVWLLAATNIAAQILTLPIVLLYFHQFPVLFLLTNLVVVPLSTCILFIEIVITCTAKCTGLAIIAGKLAFWLLRAMNSFIQHIERLPFALWQNIKTDVFQTITLYFIILLLLLWISNKNNRLLLYAISGFLVLIIYTNVDIYQTKKQQKLIVYNVPKSTAIEILHGHNSRALMSATVAKDTSLQNFYLQPAHLLYRAEPEQCNIIQNDSYTLHVNNKTIVIIGKSFHFQSSLVHKLSADAVIITGNPKFYMSQIKALINTPIVVFDGSNPAWKIERWKKDCNSLHLRFHSVAQEGAFVVDL